MYAGLGQAPTDVAASCPWPWQEAACPPSCYCDFYGAYYATDEVYVLRVVVTVPGPIDSTSKALLFARALGESFMATNPADVRGVAFTEIGAGNYQVDIVYTTTDDGVPLAQKNDAGLADSVANNAPLREEFPGLVVLSGRRLELLDKAAITYWLSAPVVWDNKIGLTKAYGRGDNVWLGTAAQRQLQLQPQTPTPVGPGTPPPGSAGSINPTHVVGAVVIGAVLWMAFRKKGSQ